MAHYKGASSEGGRAMILQKKRELAKEELEIKKRKIEEELKLSTIDNKFAAHYDAVEAQLKHSTIGLMTLDEMKAKQEVVVKEREKELAQKKKDKILSELEEKRKQKETQKRQMQTLSFKFDEDEEDNEEEEEAAEDLDEDVEDKISSKINSNGDKQSIDGVDEIVIKKEKVEIEEEEESNSNSLVSNSSNEDSNSMTSFEDKEMKRKRRNMIKNPDVDTSFLPDRDREEEEKQLREKLRQEWVEKQERLKNEDIEITFSYWDGSGHRRSAKMKKGTSVYQFLQKALEILRKEFHELRAVTADQLMYVKEDLIIPHHYTFYDFIVTKARGKSGPLFSFDVHEDVRLFADATVEKDESHAGKVLMRSWYERNKHIFPASRWEPYDPSKNYSTYTVSDRKK